MLIAAGLLKMQPGEMTVGPVLTGITHIAKNVGGKTYKACVDPPVRQLRNTITSNDAPTGRWTGRNAIPVPSASAISSGPCPSLSATPWNGRSVKPF